MNVSSFENTTFFDVFLPTIYTANGQDRSSL